MQPEPLRIQIVDEFIETVRRSEVHRPIFNGILASLTNPMKDGKPVVGAEKYTESDAHNILRILMYKHIKPYFVSTERFFNKPSMTILILRDPFIRTYQDITGHNRTITFRYVVPLQCDSETHPICRRRRSHVQRSQTPSASSANPICKLCKPYVQESTKRSLTY